MDEIEIFVEIKRETEAAYLVNDGKIQDWIPISQVKDLTEKEGNHAIMLIPEWLAKEKGFI